MLLTGAPDGLPTPTLAERGITAAVADAARQTLGLVAIRDERVDRDPFEHAVSACQRRRRRATLTAEQQRALDDAAAAGRRRARFTSRCCTA